jgi:cellulose synthase/poly-beta-1,6-N-acetylglucosamine synthase-like glycosyltransferase
VTVEDRVWPRRKEDWVRVPTVDKSNLRRRVAQFGWLTTGLSVLAVGLLVVAVFLTANLDTDTDPGQVLLPLNVKLANPGVAVLGAAALLVLASFFGLAALQTAAVMRVLDPDRHIPPPAPKTVRRARRMMLGPLDEQLVHAEQMAHELPPSALPTAEDLPSGAPVRCTVLIPAHNEEAILGLTLESLAAQTRPPDRIVVIADNCTDATVEIAREHKVECIETVGNTEKKAGALNQELARILPGAEPRDVVLVMDADSTIAPVFLESALARLEAEPSLVAVGGLFYGEDGGRFLGQYQRNEYTRYQRVVARKLGRVFVLTGTASVIRAYALRAIAQSRGPLLPGPAGKVYDTHALTEDNELTLSLKTLGARMTCPPECRVTTEIMTTWRDLWRQRLRWHRGALENIAAYGVTRATAMYWGQQLGLAYGVLALQSYLVLMTVSLLAADNIRWSPFWLAIGMIFVVERLVTVWRAGWRGRALATPMFPELAYAAFLQACFVTSIGQILRGRKADWNYVSRPAVPGLMAPLLLSWGIVLPTTVLSSDWYVALAYWVGFNTLVFAFLSILQLLPPLHRLRRAARRPETRAAS